MEKTHWKNQFNYDYLGAYSLKEGQEVTFTIKSISQEKVMGSGGKKESCTVVHFHEPLNKELKPMILNKTNCKVISKIYGTPYIEDWVGKKVIIYIENGIKAFGDIVSALRVKAEKPVLPVLVDGTEQFNKVVTALAGGYKMEQIEMKYSISKEVKAKLLKK